MNLIRRLRLSIRAAKLRVKVVTNYDYPPIPIRNCDWSAATDNYDGAEDGHCPIGRGRTELDAVTDLLEQLESA